MPQAEANMPDEFFGHVIAAARFGAELSELQEASDLAFVAANTTISKQVIIVP